MFGHVRRQANDFEFSDVSVSALEMVRALVYAYENLCTHNFKVIVTSIFGIS